MERQLCTQISLTTGIPQQCLSCRLDVLVNFGQIFALFWYFFASLRHIFAENQKGVIFMGVVAKH